MANDVIATLGRICSHVTDNGLSEGLPPGLQTELETALSPECLSEAFLARSPESGGAQHPGIDYDLVTKSFIPLDEQEGLLLLISKILKETYKEAGATLRDDPANTLLLRAVLVLLLCPVYRRPGEPWCREIMLHLSNTLINIGKCQHHHDTFRDWLLKESRLLRRAVEVFLEGLKSMKTCNDGETLNLLFSTLKFLNGINEAGGYPLPCRMFYIEDILDGRNDSQLKQLIIYDAQIQKEREMGQDASDDVTWFDYPFVLNVKMKWIFLTLEADIIQSERVQVAQKQNQIRCFKNFTLMNQNLMFPWINPLGLTEQSPTPASQLLPPVSTHLVFNNVSRKNIIASAMDNVDRCMKEEPDVWLKPLQVNFGQGEYAVDAGGPSKEFFQLLFEALMDPQLEIFKRTDDKRVSSPVWFDPKNRDFGTMKKIGLLFALLIYNRSIISLHFPLLLYEVLLIPRELVSKDLASFNQELLDRLEQLRHLSEDDLDSLDLDFGGIKSGGENVCVEKDNVEIYIEEKAMHEVAKGHFLAFAVGFDILANRSRLLRKIFKPEELRDVILGEEFDWKQLEKSTRYQQPYSSGHPAIKRYWTVFHALNESDKRRFLKFLTGGDHVPIRGFSSLGFVIRRLDTRQERYGHADPSEICPEVMTCPGYVSMDLPEYETEDDVRFRLIKAIEMSGGFFRERPSRAI